MREKQLKIKEDKVEVDNEGNIAGYLDTIDEYVAMLFKGDETSITYKNEIAYRIQNAVDDIRTRELGLKPSNIRAQYNEDEASDLYHDNVKGKSANDLYHDNVKSGKDYNDYKGIQIHNLRKELKRVRKILLNLQDIEGKDNSSDMVNDIRNMLNGYQQMIDNMESAFDKLVIGRHRKESVDEAPVTIDKDDKLASLRVIDPNNRRHDDTLNEYSPKQIRMAFGILNDPRYRDGNYSGAVAAIEKLAKGLSNHPSVAKALKRANESVIKESKVFKVKNIKWDTESSTGEGPKGLDLPNSVMVNVPHEHLGSYEDTEEFISDFITNYTGFTHKGFGTNPEITEADEDGDGKEDLKGFDASTTYSLKALQAKYPHADNLMSALMSQSEETNKRQDDGDKKRDELDKLHNKNIDTIEQKLHDVIKKNDLKEEIVNEIDPSRSPWTQSGKHPGAMSQKELKREIAVFDELRDRGDHLSPRELAQEDSLYHYLEQSNKKSLGEMAAEDMQTQASRIAEKAKWKKQRTEGIEDIAKTKTKQHTLPRIDTEKYQERDGLEGPIATRSGKVVYYDPKEGKYYDPDTDMYIEYDDMRALTREGR